MGRSKKMFIQKAIKHPGALHRSLHVPMNKKIPEYKIEKAEHSRSPKLRRRAFLAETMSHFKHKGQ